MIRSWDDSIGYELNLLDEALKRFDSTQRGFIRFEVHWIWGVEMKSNAQGLFEKDLLHVHFITIEIGVIWGSSEKICQCGA